MMSTTPIGQALYNDFRGGIDMTGILELEKTKERVSTDTWIMRLPDEVCDREGMVKGTLISMTVKDGGIKTKFISPPSEKLREISKKLLIKDRELHETLKAIGD